MKTVLFGFTVLAETVGLLIAATSDISTSVGAIDKIINYGGMTAFALGMFWLYREQTTKLFALIGEVSKNSQDSTAKLSESFLVAQNVARQEYLFDQREGRSSCAQERKEMLERVDRLVNDLLKQGHQAQGITTTRNPVKTAD